MGRFEISILDTSIGTSDPIISVILYLIVGIAVGYFIGYIITQKKKITEKKNEIIGRAREDAERIMKDSEIQAKAEYFKLREEFDKEVQQDRKEIESREKRLHNRELSLDRREETYVKKTKHLDKVESKLTESKNELEQKLEELREVVDKEKKQLYAISHMSDEQAKEVLLKRLEDEMQEEMSEIIQRVESKTKEEADKKIQSLLTTAIGRIASEHTSEMVVCSIDLPNDEMKGRIIGREGRNIRSFEKATGCDVIVDDTPGVVVISGFDAVRREVARRALEKLISDGRIHPARIEEIVENMKRDVEKSMIEYGRKASYDVGVHGLSQREIQLLGSLYFRQSQGQNILKHCVEVAHLCGALASELNLDVHLAKRVGLLHDIGKAVSHEVEGSHAKVGADVAQKNNESPAVINAIAAHHNEVEAESIYAILLQVTNRISNFRPGASKESMEKYVKRMERLEGVTKSITGVKNAYAIQAGREIHVVVDPDIINDKTIPKLCRDITKEIETQMNYPGEVQVTVVRETRFESFAQQHHKESSPSNQPKTSTNRQSERPNRERRHNDRRRGQSRRPSDRKDEVKKQTSDDKEDRDSIKVSSSK